MIALTRSELLKLLTVAREHSERDWLMLLVAFNHGLRVTEAIRLEKEQIRDGYLAVQRLKGSLKTVQALVTNPEPLLSEREPLEKYVAALQARERLFQMTRFGAHYKIRTYCKKAGIPIHKSSMHKLKHTCGMLSIKSAGIENVRQYLGHKSLASTGAYLRVTDEEASAAFAAALGG